MNIDEKLVDLWQNKPRSYFYQELKEHLKLYPNEIFKGILLISNIYIKHNLLETIAQLNRVSAEDYTNIERFFFYIHWYVLDIQTSRMAEANIILSKAEECIDSTTPKCLRADFITKCSALRNDKEFKLFKKGLALLPSESVQYKMSIANLADAFACNGELIYLEKKYTDSILPKFKCVFLFIDAIERGDTALALQQKNLVLQHHSAQPKPVQIKLTFLIKLLDLYLGKEIDCRGDSLLYSTSALLKREPKIALEQAKIYHSNPNMNAAITTNFSRTQLIRSELANKNLSACLRLIDAEKNFDHLIHSSLYYARIELLKKNQKEAILHFANMLQMSRERNSVGRLDFELDLALDLTSSQIRYLTEEANKVLAQNKTVEITSPKRSFVKKDSGADRLKGKSLAVNSVREEVKKYATFDIPILILGETGVGKDVIANAIHEESSRKSEPFIAINCSAIAESLLQSELFGHEAGAYTGATKTHKGILEEAGKGTVFLDEIGDISSGLQAILLRVLESGEYRPVGSAKPRPAHCRIIAATNAPLEARVDEGTFRMDLLYRLKRLIIKMPPLRERPVDIIFLAKYYANLNRISAEPVVFSDELQAAFQSHLWPGNVRELKNEIETMRLLNSDKSFYSMENAAFLQPIETNKAEVPSNKNPNEEPIKEETRTLQSKSTADTSKPSTKDILKNSGSYFRRLELIKDLFMEHKRLTRKEVCLITEVPNLTIGRDLKLLREEKFILKVEPTKSARTHYFILNEAD